MTGPLWRFDIRTTAGVPVGETQLHGLCDYQTASFGDSMHCRNENRDSDVNILVTTRGESGGASASQAPVTLATSRPVIKASVRVYWDYRCRFHSHRENRCWPRCPRARVLFLEKADGGDGCLVLCRSLRYTGSFHFCIRRIARWSSVLKSTTQARHLQLHRACTWLRGLRIFGATRAMLAPWEDAEEAAAIPQEFHAASFALQASRRAETFSSPPNEHLVLMPAAITTF